MSRNKSEDQSHTASEGTRDSKKMQLPSRRGKTPVTVLFPEGLDKNVAVYCAIAGESKAKFITETVAEKLSGIGFRDPYKVLDIKDVAKAEPRTS